MHKATWAGAAAALAKGLASLAFCFGMSACSARVPKAAPQPSEKSSHGPISDIVTDWP